MRSSSRGCRAGFVVAGILFAASEVVAQMSFSGLGVLPGRAASLAQDVSADGTVVTGYSGAGVGSSPNFAFRWTASGGMTQLPLPAGMSQSAGFGISSDGTTIVGTGTGNVLQGMRWRNGVAQPLGAPTGGSSRARAASADGQIVTGSANGPGFAAAFRWTSAGGFSYATNPPGWSATYAWDISDDASTVVGWGNAPEGDRAFRWTPAGVLPLGNHAGYLRITAGAISGDGSVIVGSMATHTSGPHVPYRWTEAGGYEILGRLPGDTTAYGGPTSFDGSVIVGTSDGLPFWWTRDGGMRDLSTMLANAGVDLAGWQLAEPTGLSADGSVIVGFGVHNGRTEAWIATVPAPSSAVIGMMCVGGLAIRRRATPGAAMLA